MSRSVVFHVTDRCGLGCRHCLRDPGSHATDLPTSVVARVLDEVSRVHGIRHAGFTGGDPLLWPGLAEALDEVVRRGFTWHLVTSGQGFQRLTDLLDEQSARGTGLKSIDVSLDGAREGTHDSIRGEGAWRGAMAAIAACTARSIPFTIACTVNRLNVGELEELGLLAAQLGAVALGFAMTQATGTPEDEQMYLSPQELDRVFHRAERLSTLLHIPVTVGEGFRRPSRFHVCGSFAGDVLHVTPRGELNLCCNHSGVPGGNEDVMADLSRENVVDGHRRLLDLVERLQRERLDVIEASPGSDGGWARFPCNWCLARLGKPHWVEGGSAGPRASRSRG